MTSTQLRFSASLTRTTHLVFGRDAAAPVPEPFDDISTAVGCGAGQCAAASVAFFDGWAVSDATGAASAGVWQVAEPAGQGADDDFEASAPRGAAASSFWQATPAVQASAAQAWQPTAPVTAARRDACQQSAPAVRAAVAGWQAATPASVTHRHALRAAWPAARVALQGWNGAAPAGVARKARGQEAMPPPPGFWSPGVVPPDPPAAHPVRLRFRCPLTRTTHLVFGHTCDGVPGQTVVPVLRAYIVINDVTLVRLPDNTALQAYSLSITEDADSWALGWSASLRASDLDAVMPGADPVELLATINGVGFRLVAERIGRDRRFGDARITVAGRGRAAWLASPYAATVARSNGALATAQQLADSALTVSGTPIGWSLDWQIADWLVTAGVWSHQGTHIDAVKRIAESAGGYVMGHRTAQTLRVLPRYPVLPWDFSTATPALVLPADVTRTESIAWTEKPGYNRVYVTGERTGLIGNVRRAGTAGDIVAPMVADPLITHADAARARGGAILADTGRQATVTLELPVLPATGVVDVGAFIEYHDGTAARRGIVRSVRVSASLPQVWQQIEVQTHG